MPASFINNTQFKACIFDMDGVLIDSEVVWDREIEQYFSDNEIDLSWEKMPSTMGMRYDVAIQIWHTVIQWETPSVEQVTKDILARMVKAFSIADFMSPYAHEMVMMTKKLGYKTAIASSSPDILIHKIVERLELSDWLDITHSAEHEKMGKPAPDVYLSTAKKLGVNPSQCITIEDSPNGVASAKAAGMYCIAVPDPRYTPHADVVAADMIVDSLEEISPSLLENIHHL